MTLPGDSPAKATTIPVVACSGRPPLQCVQEATLAILRHGVVRLTGAFDPALVAAWRAQFESHTLAAVQRGLYRYRLASLGDLRHHYTLEIHQRFNAPAFYANEFLYGIANALMEKDFMLATAAVAYAEPGAPAQYAHRDQVLLFSHPQLNAAMPPVSLTVSIPLVATDADTGGTEFVPGSHRLTEVPANPDFVPVHTDPGDCIVWDSRCSHRGCANPGAVFRPIVLLYYQRPWYFNFRNYTPDCEIKITEGNLAQVPAPYRHLFDWSRQLFVPPQFSALPDGQCACGSGLAYGDCHGHV